MRLLLVEDEKMLADTIKKGLEEEGFSVDVAYDGENGLLLGKLNRYDVIILDIMLPEVDGINLLMELRNSGIEAPILMLTAKDSIEDKVTSLDSGADDYLTKPFFFEELLARIRALIRRKSNVSTPIVKIKDLEINLNKKTVKRAGLEIRLTRKEYEVLLLLVLNRNRVISKEDIIENLYSSDKSVTFNAVEVLITRLRNKIDKNHHQKIIHTIKGFGYMVKDD